MKKYLFLAIAAFTMLSFATSCKKKLKDEDIQKSAQEALTKAGMDTKVAVVGGVATITGACKDDKCKADCCKQLHRYSSSRFLNYRTRSGNHAKSKRRVKGY
jgi:hypothetical protein